MIPSSRDINYFLIAISFLIGIFLTIIPLPQWAIWIRPQWMFAILLFWVFTLPLQCGVGLAWIVGILMDLITGTPLGEQAVIFVLLTYFILKIHDYIAHFSLLQQTVLIAIFSFFNIVLQGLILGFVGRNTHIALHSLSAITTAIIWPWLFLILDKCQPRVFIY
ncbi:MAG: rod shape-determining protein MreD [Gammaproteobacteria bacterium RIFCSPHIGHO2_12_FULL_42_10]|nr:MAG: rod shape-determining protein MreD [Gammaproteobacteria bacterium RIFCSPHIGHO2_12_FULL_42_10]